MKKLIAALILTLMMVVSGFANTCTDHVYQSSDGKGDLLIWPVYYAGSGATTRISMVNTDANNAVVYKMVIRSHEKSIEMLDFYVILSPNDTADFEINYDGTNYVVKSSDDSVCDASGVCGSSTTPFSANLTVPSCDTGDYGYIEAFQGAAYSRTTLGVASGAISKSVIYAKYKADVSSGTAPTLWSNETAGKAELIFSQAGDYISYDAYAFKNYKNLAVLDVQGETLLGQNANNNIGEVEAAMAKTNIEFYNFEGSIFPIITLPTKLANSCTTTVVQGPFFLASSTPAYSLSAYDTSENTKVTAGCTVSPCPVSTPSSLSGEVNILTEDTFATKGWEDLSFSQTTTTATVDGSALSYNGIPALPLNLVLDAKGMAFVKPSFTPSPVTCAGTVYNNYYSGASAAASSGGSGGGSTTTVTDCSKYTDATTCAADSDCTASTDFFGNFQKCILNCGQYKSQSNCEAAFDGNSCSWNSTFGTCGVK